MNELITVDFDTQTVSARELHKEVGSTERFRLGLKDSYSLDLKKVLIIQGVKFLTP